jgi:hypothetical protein
MLAMLEYKIEVCFGELDPLTLLEVLQRDVNQFSSFDVHPAVAS